MFNKVVCTIAIMSTAELLSHAFRDACRFLGGIPNNDVDIYLNILILCGAALSIKYIWKRGC